MNIGRAVRRLWLGVVLIAATSSVLIISDLSQRHNTGPLRRIAVVQHASQSALDDGVQGMLDALANGGFVDGKTVAITRFNAQNDLPAANAIARQVVDGGYDLVLTSSTHVARQTVANANQAGRTKHVFGIVADPFSAGRWNSARESAESSEAPDRHWKHDACGQGICHGAANVPGVEVRRPCMESDGIEFACIYACGTRRVHGYGNHAA